MPFDHHKRAPYENLVCNVDAGARVRKNGAAVAAKLSGRIVAPRGGTFWRIHSRRKIKWPPVSFGPNSINVIGINTNAESKRSRPAQWLEAIPPAKLQPADLHAAQLAKRLGKTARKGNTQK